MWFLPPFDWNATILCDDVVSAEIQPSLRLLVFSGATIITLLESTSIVLAVAIFAILRRDRKAFSKQTYRMNVQMTALLVAQVVEGRVPRIAAGSLRNGGPLSVNFFLVRVLKRQISAAR